jgi:hypothetical protein
MILRMGLSICSNGQGRNGYALSISLSTMKIVGMYVARTVMNTYVTQMVRGGPDA